MTEEGESQHNRSRFPTWLPWLVWGLLLLVFTYGLVSPESPKVAKIVTPYGWDYLVSKSAHVIGYGTLSFLVSFLPVSGWAPLRLRVALLLHGALTEYIQTFVPGRNGNPVDVAIDLSGIMLGWG